MTAVNIDEPITLVPYDPGWPACFLQEKESILDGLLDDIRAIEHIGSTAIPGLLGKPIIDILVGVQGLPLSESHIRALEALQYEQMGEAGVPGRVYFRKRGARSFNLAVVRWNGPLWKNNLLVRDFLLSHPERAAKYADLKRSIVSGGISTLLGYSAKKEAFIAELLQQAHTDGMQRSSNAVQQK